MSSPPGHAPVGWPDAEPPWDELDPGMAELVGVLRAAGFCPVGSCSGHRGATYRTPHQAHGAAEVHLHARGTPDILRLAGALDTAHATLEWARLTLSIAWWWTDTGADFPPGTVRMCLDVRDARVEGEDSAPRPHDLETLAIVLANDFTPPARKRTARPSKATRRRA